MNFEHVSADWVESIQNIFLSAFLLLSWLKIKLYYLCHRVIVLVAFLTSKQIKVMTCNSFLRQLGLDCSFGISMKQRLN